MASWDHFSRVPLGHMQFDEKLDMARKDFEPFEQEAPDLVEKEFGIIPTARLNQSIYWNRPRISFCVNYFKRPWFIDQFVKVCSC